jgi:hypothetical protein
MSREISVIVGDLLDQPVQVVVSEWYYSRPAWMTFAAPPSARVVREQAGAEVFRELGEEEPLDEGEASLTGSGRLRNEYKGFIHVAARSVWGKSSEDLIAACARNAMDTVHALGFRAVAFPVIGVTRSIGERRAYEVLRDALLAIPSDAELRIIRSPDRHD